MSKLKKFKLNTLSNYVLLIARLLLSIIVVPYYLEAFGEERYGIYILSFGLTSALAFLDLGAGKSILRYSAEFHSDKNTLKFSDALSHSISLYAYGVSIIVLFQFGMAFFATSFFNIPAMFQKETISVFMLSSVFSLLYFLQQIPFNLLQGREIFFSRNLVQFFNLAFTVLILVLLSWLKFGLITFVLLNILYQCIILVSDLYLVRKNKILKDVKIYFLSYRRLLDSEYFKFSKNSFLASSIAVLSQQADKYILSAMLSVQYVTIYTVVTKPYFVVKSLLSNVYTVLQPILVKKYKEKDFDGLKKNIIDFTHITVLIIYPVLICAVLLIPPFFSLWIKNELYGPYYKWGGLAIANLGILIFSSVFIRLFSLTDHSNINLKLELWGTLLNFVLSIILTFFFGMSGVVMGTTVQFFVVFVLIYRIVPSILHIRIREIFHRQIILFILWAIFIALFFYWLIYLRDINIDSWLKFIYLSLVLVFSYLPLQIFYLKKMNLFKYLF